jgi:uncharacterized protein (DUF362 family)
MAKKTTVAIAHSSADLGKPGEYSREQLDLVKQMIRQIADQTMNGMQNIVKRGDKVLIKVNTVIPVPPNAGFTTDPRMLQALIELVSEQNPSRIQIGERCAMGADTQLAMEECGLAEVAKRTGAELCPFEHSTVSTCTRSTGRSPSTSFPFPAPSAKLTYISDFRNSKCTCIRFSPVRSNCNSAICRITTGWFAAITTTSIRRLSTSPRAANPKWYVMDSLYACQGNGPFSPYAEDLIKDWNTICGGPDPVAVDTVCEALMDWDYPGTNAPATVLAAAEGHRHEPP